MLTIGRVAKKARVSTDCVRFYERVGLLAASSKTAAGYRLYDEECVRRLIFIKHAQRCSFSLPQIRELLNADTPADRKAAVRLAVEKREEIEQTIVALRAMGEALSAYIRAGDATAPQETSGANILVSALSGHIPGSGDAERRGGVATTRPDRPGSRSTMRVGLSSI